jgi:hypothetical protein
VSQILPRDQLAAAPTRPDSRFTLSPTRNNWVFLLLDSSTGRIWQVHFALNDSSFAGRLPINEEALALPASARAGRFTLQETQNIFTFLLLDQDNGQVWQIQWSNEDDSRGVVRQLSRPLP